MKYLVVLFAGLFQISGLIVECPENVHCLSSLDRHSCPPGKYFRERVKSNKCCPGCVPLFGLNERCAKDSQCAPGLKCSQRGSVPRKCTLDPSQHCEYYKLNDETYKKDQYWQPDCLPNGKYAPKQCKGSKLSGKCFCTDGSGARILGEKHSLDAENMTCACSRLANEMRAKGKGLSLHCDENGNFEELQCENEVCWCSNERTGTPYTPVVPEMMITILPCFDKNTFGSQYLRQCESVLVHTQRALKLLDEHGTRNIVISTPNCDYDGSYARVQRAGLNKKCVQKDNSRLTDPNPSTVDCNCAYDRSVAEEEGQDFSLMCTIYGSYEPFLILGDKQFSIDSDGFPHSLREA